MSSERQSARVFRDALNLSEIGKRRLFRAVCRTLMGNVADPFVMFKELRADLLAVAGEVRRIDNHKSGDTHDHDAR